VHAALVEIIHFFVATFKTNQFTDFHVPNLCPSVTNVSHTPAQRHVMKGIFAYNLSCSVSAKTTFAKRTISAAKATLTAGQKQ
jgi:hypothetical protein